jgi:hypothetical protein
MTKRESFMEEIRVRVCLLLWITAALLWMNIAITLLAKGA